MNSIYVILALVVLLLLIFIWISRKKDTFTYSTPASPIIREAAGDLLTCLHLATRYANPSDQLSCVLENAGKYLSKSPPTYANYLAIYSGLSDADSSLLNAADAYSEIGRREMNENLIHLGNRIYSIVESVHKLGVALGVE